MCACSGRLTFVRSFPRSVLGVEEYECIQSQRVPESHAHDWRVRRARQLYVQLQACSRCASARGKPTQRVATQQWPAPVVFLLE
eukprot:SAG11_NODE_1723_length_4373_cov_8.121666_1_plen_84_part_00